MLRSMKIITCHIGNGASVTAINHGKSVDTSMGFTPLAGVLMGTRSGDLDPAIPLYMIENMGMSVAEVQNALNKKGGILGLSEYSNDMREIEDKILNEHDQKIATAFDVYCYRIKKYIGAYAAAMNGVDIIVFTGGVGRICLFCPQLTGTPKNLSRVPHLPTPPAHSFALAQPSTCFSCSISFCISKVLVLSNLSKRGR